MRPEDETTTDHFGKETEKSHKRGKIMGGMLIVVIGSLYLARELGADLPSWLFSWKTLLIAIGLITAVKCNFRSMKWLVPVLIGGAFLVGDFYPGLALHALLWPVLVIVIGLFMIFKPYTKHDRFKNRMHHKYGRYECSPNDYTESSSEEDRIESTTFMGAVKKNILSKNFKGGDIHNVLGGSEINLSQADFNGTIILEITNILGGALLVVPPHWEIRSELVSVMGSIEDKRILQPNNNPDKDKVLILKGTVFMGGIEIKSY